MENYEIFKILSDKNRYEILNIIKKEKEICACNLLKNFDITQATFAYHMKLLKESNLVTCHKQGTWCIYQINKETMQKLNLYFKGLGE